MLIQKRKFFYVGEGESQVVTPAGTTPVTTPVTTPATPEGDEELKGFTPAQQEVVNKIVGERVKKSKEETKKTIESLEQMKTRVNLSQVDKDNLTKQIEDLNKTLFTKEELAAKEKRELAAKHENEVKAVKEKADQWQSRYVDSTITRALQDAAVTAEAFSPKQVVSLLKTKARVVEVAGPDGTATGNFEVKVTFEGRDKDGKPATFDLSPEETLKQMKAAPDEYGNLFKSGVTGGIGGTNAGGGGAGNVTEAQIKDPEFYHKNRQKIKTQIG